MKPRFSVGDLVVENAIPEAGYPTPECRPLLIVSVDEVGDENWDGDTIYLVVEPGGSVSQRFEYEIIPYEDRIS